MLEGVIAVMVAEIVTEIVLRLKEREGGCMKAERAFESKRFQQGRASRRGFKKYCTVQESRKAFPACSRS
jgi:hypothetical protein